MGQSVLSTPTKTPQIIDFMSISPQQKETKMNEETAQAIYEQAVSFYGSEAIDAVNVTSDFPDQENIISLSVYEALAIASILSAAELMGLSLLYSDFVYEGTQTLFKKVNDWLSSNPPGSTDS